MYNFLFLVHLLLICCYADENTFAVIVATSDFFRNYRHSSNALSILKQLQENGVPRNHIILMLSGDIQCNARNKYFGEMRLPRESCDLMDGVNINYVGSDVTVDTIIGVLTNRFEPFVSSQNRIFPNSQSRILFFLNGHGGEDFIKIREKEEINSAVIYSVISDMYAMKRYGEMLVIIDSCQAASLIPKKLPPHTVFLASSNIGEESYSLGSVAEMGTAIKDRFVNSLLSYMKECKVRNVSIQELMSRYLHKQTLGATAVISSTNPSASLCNFFRSFHFCLTNNFQQHT